MRKLTAKQKKMLKASVTKYYNDHHEFPIDVFDLPDNLEIDNINPCELFWQNANRFMQDEIYKIMVGTCYWR